MTYTAADARREARELLEEGYNFSEIRIFLNDLARSKDITWEDVTKIQKEMIETGVQCSIATL
jgi:hypothetical protein